MAIEAVLPVRFNTWVRKRPFAIVFLGVGVSTPRPRAVFDGIPTLYPKQVSVGWMARDTVPNDRWWAKHWQTDLGPYMRGQTPPVGVYLFHVGLVAGHTPITASSSRLECHKARDYLLERMKLKSSQGGDGTAWTWQARQGNESRRYAPPPSAVRQVSDDDPYSLLGVVANADDTEVKKAYRTALKLNHPDRVAHMSAEIQEFARERTQLIIGAWDAIKAMRGLR